jgi:hypothetical protein
MQALVLHALKEKVAQKRNGDSKNIWTIDIKKCGENLCTNKNNKFSQQVEL